MPQGVYFNAIYGGGGPYIDRLLYTVESYMLYGVLELEEYITY